MNSKNVIHTLVALFSLTIIFVSCSSDDDSGSGGMIAPELKVYEGDVVLTSQDEVDAFGTESYNEIDGSMTIGFSNLNETDINNLDALNSISSIKDGLTISNNPLLIDLVGLDALTYINSGSLVISSNETLSTTSALFGLVSFRSLVVEDNPALLNLDGLEGVRVSRGSLIVTNNISLANINGLSGLRSVEGKFLFISGNNLLSSITGLSNLQFVTGDFVLSRTRLSNLNALENLEVINGGFYISYNESLTDFCGILPLINDNGLDGVFSTIGNAYDPSVDDLNTDACSI